MKTKIIPFDLETAKKIQAGEIEGKMVEVTTKKFTYNSHGCIAIDQKVDKFIELPEEAPKQKGELTLGKCKEGDEVWIYSNYEYGPEYVKVKVGKYSLDTSSGHRRNIIFENGFTCQELVCQTCWYENPDEQKTKTKEFKPFDKVLVRGNDASLWRAGFYSHELDGKHCVCGDYYAQCIPYEGNQELVGTTDKPKED